MFVDPEPARIGRFLIAVSLLAALNIFGFIGPDHYTAGGLQEIGIGIRNMEIHGFVIIVGYQDDGIRVGGQHGQHGADSAVAGKKLAKFAGFIDDKGLVGELPQFQFTEYDTHNIRVTVVEGNCNQREAVPGRFFYEKLRNGVVKTFYFYAQCGAAHIMELL